MNLSEGNIKLREKFLTSRLRTELIVESAKLPARTTEYFTGTPTTDLPKAFRVGDCKVVEPGAKVQFDILLFWKDDTRTEQRHVSTFVKKENDSWLIDSVSP
jgi:hypothetical protein